MDLFRGLSLPSICSLYSKLILLRATFQHGVVYNLKYLFLNETMLVIGFAQFDFIPASATVQLFYIV